MHITKAVLFLIQQYFSSSYDSNSDPNVLNYP